MDKNTFDAPLHTFDAPLPSISSQWIYWRDECEIKRAVRALTEFEDQTLRDMGITDRSQIEFTVRFCREC
jgi:uncharacterized protein YjiS (DUF1127 family)